MTNDELNPSVTMKTDMNAKQALNVNDLKTQSTGSFNNMLLATKSCCGFCPDGTTD